MGQANNRFSGERITAWLTAGTVIGLFVFYAVFLARNLVPQGPELAVMIDATGPWAEVSSVPGALWWPWIHLLGNSVEAGRLLSVAAALAALIVFLRAAQTITQENIIGPFLALTFVLFPPWVAAFAMATPHAVVVLLMVSALDALSRSTAGRWHAILAGALVSAASALLPLGAAIAGLWLVLVGCLIQRWRGVVWALGVLAVSAGAQRALGLSAPIIDATLLTPQGESVGSALLMPFAMVITAAVLSALTLLSASVRARIGLARAGCVVLAPVVMGGLLVLAADSGVYATGQLTTAAAVLMPFSLFAAWPLVAWVRHDMPKIRAFWAWVVLPVVMYSCFWVILGPVKADKFPYSHLQADARQPQAAGSR